MKGRRSSTRQNLNRSIPGKKKAKVRQIHYEQLGRAKKKQYMAKTYGRKDLIANHITRVQQNQLANRPSLWRMMA